MSGKKAVVSLSSDSEDAFVPPRQSRTLEEEIRSLRQQLAASEREVARLREENAELVARKNRLSSSNSQYKDRISRLEEELKAYTGKSRLARKPAVGKGQGATDHANTAAPELQGMDRLTRLRSEFAEDYRITIANWTASCSKEPFAGETDCFGLTPKKGSGAARQPDLLQRRQTFLHGFKKHHLGDRIPAHCIAAYLGYSRSNPGKTVPTGFEASHLCHFPGCVNPAHVIAEDPTVHGKRTRCQALRDVEKRKCECGQRPPCYTVIQFD